jgi:Zn-dependent protease
MILSIPGKIPIYIHPIFWLVVFLLAGINSDFAIIEMVIWAIVIFISVVIHEFGHALTAVVFGQEARIDLVGFGGVTHRQGPHLSLRQEFLIVLNGPLAGLGLAFVSYFLAYFFENKSNILFYTFEIAFYANIFWTVINLLPIQPLDGGHLLRIIFEGIFGLRGVKIALFIGVLTALLITLFFFIRGSLIMGAFFMMFAFENYRSWKSSLQLTDSDRDTNLQKLLKSAEKDYQKGNLESALHKLKHLRQLTDKGVLYLTGSQTLAKILDATGRDEEAYQVLLPLKSSLPPESLSLLQKLAYRRGEWQSAISIGTLAYQQQPSYEAALLNALSSGRLGDAKGAVGWLQCAINDGMPNLPEVINNSDFNSVRRDPLFEKLAK